MKGIAGSNFNDEALKVPMLVTLATNYQEQ
jgi:hypothetical protein